MKKSLTRIDYSHRFIKDFKKASLTIKKAFRERLEIFLKDSGNPLLRNHALSGKLSGYRSINVTGDWRAIFRQYIKEEEEQRIEVIFFTAFGTHSQLYG